MAFVAFVMADSAIGNDEKAPFSDMDIPLQLAE
jgi:hypothetical protein